MQHDLVLLGADEELVLAGDDLHDAPLADEHDEDEDALEHVQHVEEVPGKDISDEIRSSAGVKSL